MSDPEESTREVVAAWFERDHEQAKALVEEARNAGTVGESQKLAHEARRKLARAEAFQDVLKIIGRPDGRGQGDDDE